MNISGWKRNMASKMGDVLGNDENLRGDLGDGVPFAPPAEAIEVVCIHCGERFSSADMVLKEWPGIGLAWSCPKAGERGVGCDGVGFLFDIWPVDPDWRDENGDKVWALGPEDETEADWNQPHWFEEEQAEDYTNLPQWTPDGDEDFIPIDHWQPDTPPRSNEEEDETGGFEARDK